MSENAGLARRPVWVRGTDDLDKDHSSRTERREDLATNLWHRQETRAVSAGGTGPQEAGRGLFGRVFL